jgi:hypothetical protein
MKRKFETSLVLLAAICAAPAYAQEEAESGFLKDLTYSVNWRVRYEAVDQTGFEQEASAFTSRVRAGLETGKFAGTHVQAEMVSVSDMSSDYNSTTNGQTDYPVVADPGGFTEINRLALINDSLAKTRLTLGRQRINLDDARFVGNVGWRQNEQTFDGLSAKMTGDKFAADLAYLNQVNRIFGPDSPNGEWNGDVVMLNGSRSFGFGKLTAFAYGMEFDEAAAASNETLGIRLTGSQPFGDNSFIYTLSYAAQSEAGDNPADYSEDYWKLEGGVTRRSLTVAIGQELLSGDGTVAFQTPLATLHAFQGWGDKFLATPANGMQDSYLRLAWRPAASGPFDSVSVTGFYHQFDADLGSATYGDEVDVALAATTGRFTLTLKYAAYEAESYATDTDKLWASMDYAF